MSCVVDAMSATSSSAGSCVRAVGVRLRSGSLEHPPLDPRRLDAGQIAVAGLRQVAEDSSPVVPDLQTPVGRNQVPVGVDIDEVPVDHEEVAPAHGHAPVVWMPSNTSLPEEATIRVRIDVVSAPMPPAARGLSRSGSLSQLCGSGLDVPEERCWFTDDPFPVAVGRHELRLHVSAEGVLEQRVAEDRLMQES